MKCLEMCFYFQTFINFLNFRLLLFYDLTPVVEGHTVESQPLSVCSFLFCGLTHGQFCGVFHAPLRTRTDRAAVGCGARRPLVHVCRRRCPADFLSVRSRWPVFTCGESSASC